MGMGGGVGSRGIGGSAERKNEVNYAARGEREVVRCYKNFKNIGYAGTFVS
jgi:hypothetical protein